MHEQQAPVDVEALTSRIAALTVAGRTGAARSLLVAARRLAPPSALLTQLSAAVAMQEGRLDAARSELDAAIAASPHDAGLRKSRAELRHQQGDHEGAAADAAEAVVLDRHDHSAKAMLGLLMLELGRAPDAIACLAEAVSAVPNHPGYREGLAAAQEAAGDVEAARSTLAAGIAAAPAHAGLRNAATLLAVRQRDFTTAVRLADEACSDGIADACLFGLKGHALSSLGRHDEAADAYAEALKLGPDDPYVRHLVAASGKLPARERADVNYVRAVFDGYAERFDQHLVSLGYRVPGLIRGALLQHRLILGDRPIGPTLDLGCGTGLVAVALSDLPVEPIIGVDISRRMLAQAAEKQLYAELREGDLMQVLAEESHRWRLIVAGDVLCYFGDLRELFGCAYRCLEGSGWFVFSAEELVADAAGTIHGNGEWALHRQGRYAHAMPYIERIARDSGFAIRSLGRQTLRYEANAPVPGLIGILERRSG
jgi:predicted TPR repeat methyltransferase